MTYLYGLGLSASSRNNSLSTIKSFFRYLSREEDVIIGNKLMNIPRAKTEIKIPTVLTTEEMIMLLDKPNISTNYGARDKAVLELLYGSGLRISEACNIKVGDIYNDHILVMGKGSKERLIPTSTHFRAAIKNYWEKFRDKKTLKHENYAFLNIENKKLDRFSFWYAIKKYIKQCNINKNVSPHTLRHSFAVHLLNNGAEIRIIQDLLGHSNIGTTGLYLNLFFKDVLESFNNHHPRNSNVNHTKEQFYLEIASDIIFKTGKLNSKLVQKRLKINSKGAIKFCKTLKKMISRY